MRWDGCSHLQEGVQVAEQTSKPPAGNGVARKLLEVEVDRALGRGGEEDVGHQAPHKVRMKLASLKTGRTVLRRLLVAKKLNYLWFCRMALSYTNERFHLRSKLMSSNISTPITFDPLPGVS